MKTVNSVSGGKTSAYIAAHYPADYDIFCLVRTNDKKCKFPDSKIRQIVSDKLGVDFIGTLEQDEIIYTMLDLEQYIGRKIYWLTGKPFDEIIIRPGGKKFLPNKLMRFCTIEMKLRPKQNWWRKNINEPIECRIGFRANEQRRAKSMLSRTELDGFLYEKFIIGENKSKGLYHKIYKKYESVKYEKPTFPLIEDGIYNDTIQKFWKDKPVRFAYANNCVGCFHRSPIFLKKMQTKSPNKFQWFVDAEKNLGYSGKNGGFKDGIKYKEIKNWNTQAELFDDDFNDCDSGYCGL
tara:strand:- start:95 stop:973 length:879 start_codon:yes stop_codon:yes gene_type:complete